MEKTFCRSPGWKKGGIVNGMDKLSRRDTNRSQGRM